MASGGRSGRDLTDSIRRLERGRQSGSRMYTAYF